MNDDNIEHLIKIDDEIGDQIKIGEGFSIEKTKETAQKFAQNLRNASPKIITHPALESYTGNEWYVGTDLVSLADRYHIPLMLFVEKGDHYLLALNKPQKSNQGWQVLVYDPFHGGERYFRLENWRDDYSDGFELIRQGAYVNAQGFEELQQDEYNYSLLGDNKLTEIGGTLAFSPSVQNDDFNCGPFCLFAAAVREGLKSDFNTYKFAGRDKINQDLGIKLPLREEITNV